MDEKQTIEGQEQAAPQPTAPAPAPPATATTAVATPGPVAPTGRPRGRPKGSKTKGKAKGSKAKGSSSSSKRPAPARAARDEHDDDDDDEHDDEHDDASSSPATLAPSQDEPSDEPETPEQRAERYATMRRKILEHGPAWERRLGPLEPGIALALVYGAGSTVPAEAEFTVEIPTNASGSHRRVKMAGPKVIINALAQLAAAYSPDGISEVVAHPCAPAVGALADVASAVLLARLAGMMGGSISWRRADEDKDDAREQSAPAPVG